MIIISIRNNNNIEKKIKNKNKNDNDNNNNNNVVVDDIIFIEEENDNIFHFIFEKIKIDSRNSMCWFLKFILISK